MRRIFLPTAFLFFAIISSAATHAQTIQVSPTALTFPTVQPIGSPLPGTLQVIITNTGTQTVTMQTATLTGDFMFGSSPPSQKIAFAPTGTLLPGNSMGFLLQFNATAAGTRTGTLTLVDDAQGTPQTFSVSGTGFTGAMIQPLNAKLDLVADVLGTPASQIEEIVAVGNQTVSISSVAISGTGFSETDNCGGALTQGQNCQINVVFNPSVAGPQTGTLTVANTGATNPLTIPLTGDAGDFALSIDPSQASATITAGQQASFPFFIQGFLGSQGIGAISFTCAGLPPGASCMAVSTGQNLPSGPLPAALLVSTTGRGSASLHGSPVWKWSGAVMAAVILVGWRKRRFGAALSMVVGSLLLAALISCGGSSNSAGGTPVGTFNLTVTGTRNGLTHNFPVTLTVR
jgi:hypothetical protein